MQSSTQIETPISPVPDEVYQACLEAKQYAQHFVKKVLTHLSSNHLSDPEYNQLYQQHTETYYSKTQIDKLWNQLKIADPTALVADAHLAYFEATIEKTKKSFIGTCKHFAFLALEYLATHYPHINAEIVHIKNGDHVFVVVGVKKGAKIKDPSTYGDEAYLCDPWADLIIKAKDWQTRDRAGEPRVKNYFCIGVWHLQFEIDLSKYLPETAYRVMAPNHYVIHIRDTDKESLACDAKTGQSLCRLGPLQKALIDCFGFQDTGLVINFCDLVYLPLPNIKEIIRLVRFLNFTESLQKNQYLERLPKLNKDQLVSIRNKERLEKIFNIKKQRLIVAAEKLQTAYALSALRLKRKYGREDPKFQIVNEKARLLANELIQLKHQLEYSIKGGNKDDSSQVEYPIEGGNKEDSSQVEEKKSIALAEKQVSTKSMPRNIYSELHGKLYSGLNQFYNLVLFERKEHEALAAYRENKKCLRLFSIRPTTIRRLTSAVNEFKTSLKKLR